MGPSRVIRVGPKPNVKCPNKRLRKDRGRRGHVKTEAQTAVSTQAGGAEERMGDGEGLSLSAVGGARPRRHFHFRRLAVTPER